MARIRSVKPEIWLSPQVMSLSRGARLLFIGLITQADDEGRGSADPRRLKAAIFGGDDDVTVITVAEWVAEIGVQRLAMLYDGNGHGPLYQLTGWHNHQAIDRPRKSNYPRPPDSAFQEVKTSNAHRAPVEDTSNTRRGSEGSEGRKDLKTRAPAVINAPVDNGDNSARRARAPDQLKKSNDRERNQARTRALVKALSAGAKI